MVLVRVVIEAEVSEEDYEKAMRKLDMGNITGFLRYCDDVKVVEVIEEYE